MVYVHVGDSVQFKTPGGHTVSFVGPTLPRQFAFITPGPSGSTYAGIDDSAASPFYFNGFRKWVYNVGVIAPIGSTTISSHGLDSRAVGRDFGSPSVTFKFTQAGTYGYRCLFHPGMYGKIVVLPKTTPVRGPAAVTARADAQTLAGWTTARELIAAHPPANTIVTGPERNGVTIFAFAPQTLHVTVGTTVKFVAGSSTESHNVGFGPLPWLRSFIVANDLFPTGPTSPNQIDPVLLFGSDVAPRTHTAGSHGNGFVATPALDRAAGTPLRRNATITFTEPGTFTLLLHDPLPLHAREGDRLALNAAAQPPLTKALASAARAFQRSAPASGARASHSFIARPCIGSNGEPSPDATSSSTRSFGSLTASSPRKSVTKNFPPVLRPGAPNIWDSVTPGSPSWDAATSSKSASASTGRSYLPGAAVR